MSCFEFKQNMNLISTWYLKRQHVKFKNSDLYKKNYQEHLYKFYKLADRQQYTKQNQQA